MSFPARCLANAITQPALRLWGCAPAPTALPRTLAFWALWHCRHARPPDSSLAA